MQVKSLRQFERDNNGKSAQNSSKYILQQLPLYAYYNGEYYPVDTTLKCVVGERVKNRPPKPPATKEQKSDYVKAYQKAYYSKNPEKRVAKLTRSLMYNSFKRACNGKYRKSKRTEVILGCKMIDFIFHIQSLFLDGMSFSNYGEWHIDHIKPLALAKTECEIFQLCHYKNLQPLWAIENRKKGSKYEQ